MNNSEYEETIKHFEDAINHAFGVPKGKGAFWVHIDVINCRHDVKINPLAVCTECDGHAPHVYDLTACGEKMKYHQCEECGHLQNKFTLNQ